MVPRLAGAGEIREAGRRADLLVSGRDPEEEYVEAQHRSGQAAGGERVPAEHVWMLVGALGSVGALLRFLRAVPQDRPLAFVVAVRASADGLGLLGDLIARTTPFVTHLAGLERMLYPRDLLLVPLDGVEEDDGEHDGERGRVRPLPAPRRLDDVLQTVAGAYRDKAGVIFFSGIGVEGAAGCHAILRHGGRIWTQDSASSEYSALPAFIEGICDVSATGTPEALGQRLAREV